MTKCSQDATGRIRVVMNWCISQDGEAFELRWLSVLEPLRSCPMRTTARLCWHKCPETHCRCPSGSSSRWTTRKWYRHRAARAVVRSGIYGRHRSLGRGFSLARRLEHAWMVPMSRFEHRAAPSKPCELTMRERGTYNPFSDRRDSLRIAWEHG